VSVRIEPDAPIVPGVGLGGLRVGAHIQEYWGLIFAEYRNELLDAPDFFRWERKPWQHLARSAVSHRP
jgi:hypothetical protein